MKIAFNTAWIVLTLILSALQVYSRSVDLLPRDGDNYYQCEIEPILPGSAGKDVVWNFSHARIIGERHVRWRNIGDTAIAHVRSGWQRTYMIKGDSVMLLAEETALSALKPQEPLLVSILPLAYGDSLGSALTMRGNYCSANGILGAGRFAAVVDGVGTLILPEDTICGVLRLHESRAVALNVSKSLQEPDSATSNPLTIVLDNYLWLSPDYSFPLAESMSMRFLCNEVPVQENNYMAIYPPEMQDYDFAERNEFLRKGFLAPLAINRKPSQSGGLNPGDIQQGERNSNVLSSVEFKRTVNGFAVFVVSGAAGDVEMVLTDVYGRVFMSVPRRHVEPGEAFIEHLAPSSLPWGSYIIHVRAGEQTIQQRFMIM